MTAEPREVLSNNVMIRVNGSTKSFRCSCGCNVFHQYKDEPDRYYCNGCPAVYSAEEENEH